MPSCSILRIACAQEGKPEQFWSVVQGGGLKLGSESEAQCFVCHSELADRSCLIQHLQSGAFIEQGADRKLKLALSPASALPFSKLAAYSEGGNQVVKDSVWLRAASGGVVCSNAHDELIVAVNAAPCPARECCFTFETVDPNSFLMQGLACQSPEVHKEDSPLKLHHCPASVSIAAKPATHSLSNRSAAVPIALKRPIRKVSFNDLSLLHQSSSDQRSAPLHSALPRKSSSFSYSYSLKDAFSNRIPSSPACSHPSEGSDTDESKVRGGHHFDSDRLSSTDSLSILDQSLLGTPDSSAATSSPSDTLSSSLPSQQTSHDLISVNIADDLHHPVEQLQQGISANQLELGSNQLESSGRQGTHAGSPLAGSESPGRLDSYWTSWGSKTRGGNLFKKDGVRSTQSNSALSSIANGSHATAHRALNGHRTHGSQTALDFLSNSCSPRSPRRIPKTAEVPLDFAQSAPVMGEGLLANDGHRSLHGSTHDAHWPSFSSPQSPWDFSRKGLESLEAPSSLRLSRSSMDSHPREPMLPCIHEGVPSQDSEALERTAVETLLSRCGWRGDLNNGMKRVSSSPDMHNSINSPHPAIHKVTLRGSPSDGPSPFKRHHTHAASGDMCSHQLSPQMARLGLSVPV